MSHSRRISSSSTEMNLIHFYKAKSLRQSRIHFICQLYRMQKILQRTSMILYQNLAGSKMVCSQTLTRSLMSPTMKYLSCQHRLLHSLLIQILNYLLKPHQLRLDVALHQTSNLLLKHQESESNKAHLTRTLHKTASLSTAIYITRVSPAPQFMGTCTASLMSHFVTCLLISVVYIIALCSSINTTTFFSLYVRWSRSFANSAAWCWSTLERASLEMSWWLYLMRL
jgi:hypothetical protein